MKRGEILDTAKEYVCKDRNASYGEPEDNFQNIANLWNSYLIAKCGVCIPKLEAVDVGIMMTLLKIARMASGNKEDNFIDAAGYIACAGEIATNAAEIEDKRIAHALAEDSMRETEKKLKRLHNICREEGCAERSTDNPLSIYYSGKREEPIRPLILDGVVCMYETPSKEEMDKFWHDVLTSNGDVD